MTPDPNADLVGYIFPVTIPHEGELEIIGTWPVDESYVLCRWMGGRAGATTTVRKAAQVRRAVSQRKGGHERRVKSTVRPNDDQDFACKVCGKPDADWDESAEELRCPDHRESSQSRAAMGERG